jgi:hypothetical protein
LRLAKDVNIRNVEIFLTDTPNKGGIARYMMIDDDDECNYYYYYFFCHETNHHTTSASNNMHFLLLLPCDKHMKYRDDEYVFKSVAKPVTDCCFAGKFKIVAYKI